MSTVKQTWPQLLAEANKKQKSTVALLSLATLAGCRGNCILLSFEEGQAILGERIMEAGHRKLIQEVLSNLLSHPVRIDVIPLQEAGLAPGSAESKAEGPGEGALKQEEPEETVSGLEQPGLVQAGLVERAARMFNGKIFEVDEKEGK